MLPLSLLSPILIGLILVGLIAVDGIYFYHKGYSEYKLHCLAEKSTALEARTKLQAQLQVKAQEELSTVANLSATYNQELRQNETSYQLNINRLATGKLRLREPASPSLSNKLSSASLHSTLSASNDQAGCELSTKTSEFLLTLAKDADRNTEQLAECQGELAAQHP